MKGWGGEGGIAKIAELGEKVAGERESVNRKQGRLYNDSHLAGRNYLSLQLQQGRTVTEALLSLLDITDRYH